MKETKKNGAAQSKAGKRDYSAFKNMYRKIPQDLRDVIVYYIGDRPLVIHEGVNEVTGEVVTAEFIRQWHMDRDREVYNNNKHNSTQKVHAPKRGCASYPMCFI